MVKTDPIIIAVVGHANAGKTSLMRTLLRDRRFGAVSNHPGTTRHVEGGALVVNGKAVITLYDTPGLEDSIGLLETLDELGPNLDGIDRLQRFLTDLDQYPSYRQEAKVLRQLLHSDLFFYVIDCREPVLGKYLDELKTLSYAARPIIPVLNFVAAPRARTELWREQLARLGLHATVEFDTVVFSFEGEKRLYQKIQSLLSPRYDDVQRLINERQQQWQLSFRAAARIIAELLVNTGAYRIEVPREQTDLTGPIDELRSTVRQAESDCVKDLLQLFRFDPDHLDATALPVSSDQWQADLFDPENLKQFGVKASGAVMKGAAAGAGIDLLTGGLSLGAATALGAAAGLVLGGGQRFGRDISARVRGYRQLCVEDSTLQVMWHRQLQLLYALLDRGHAAQATLQYRTDNSQRSQLPADWNKWLVRIRSNRQWSDLGKGRWALLTNNSGISDPERDKIVQEISREIAPDYQAGNY